MNPEKVVKYSVPFFAAAIISRSIEEISFVYYAVPVMCILFIVLVLRGEQPSSLPVRQTGLQADKESLTSKVRSLSFHVSFRQGPESEVEKRSDSLFASLKRMTSILLFLIPGAWFLLTSLWSSYPEVSATRALYFILISAGCISAGILWIRYSEKNIFEFLLPANAVVVLISIFSLITNIPSDSWTGGHGKGFMGFFGHQNLLASVLLFTLPAVLYQAVILVKSRIPIFFAYRRGEQHQESDSEQVGMTMRSGMTNNDIRHLESSIAVLIAYFLLLTANLLLLTLTYSRSAIIALIFGVIVLLILNKNWKVLLYGATTAILLVIVIKFIPPLNQFTDTIIKKDFPEVYSSRLWMWEPSYQAALEGGFFGLGYGISHPEIRSGEYSDRFENGRLIREKGNSSLALIEETGIVGLILFLIPLTLLLRHGWRDAWRHENHKHAIPPIRRAGMQSCNLSILIASLAAFILHAQFEAWWVGVGSVQLPLFFIYTGILFNKRTISSK